MADVLSCCGAALPTLVLEALKNSLFVGVVGGNKDL